MDDKIIQILRLGVIGSDWFKRWIWLEDLGWIEQYHHTRQIYANLLGGRQQRLTGPLAQEIVNRFERGK